MVTIVSKFPIIGVLTDTASPVKPIVVPSTFALKLLELLLVSGNLTGTKLMLNCPSVIVLIAEVRMFSPLNSKVPLIY